MSTVPQPRLITVEEFERLAGDSRAELIDGVIVDRPVPNKDHQEIQLRLQDLLRSLLGSEWKVFAELEFRPKPDYSMPRADLVAIARDRWRRVPGNARLTGAPELHIEILSPSNTASGIKYKRRLSLTHGSLQFWTVDPEQETVEVTTQDGLSREFRRGERISLEAFGAGDLEVDEIFTHLDEL